MAKTRQRKIDFFHILLKDSVSERIFFLHTNTSKEKPAAILEFYFDRANLSLWLDQALINFTVHAETAADF